MAKMGILQECMIHRLDGSDSFKGHSWAREDGTLEAFWYEEGNRITHFFYANGQPMGFWNKYRIQFPRG